MYAQIIILKDLWKRMTNPDNPRVTLTMGIIQIIMAFAYCGSLMMIDFIHIRILGIAAFIVLSFLEVSMLIETRRLKRIIKDKGYWFWSLNPTYINKMNYADFEECVLWIFSTHGYKCKRLCKHSHEHGADIIAEKTCTSIADKTCQSKYPMHGEYYLNSYISESNRDSRLYPKTHTRNLSIFIIQIIRSMRF